MIDPAKFIQFAPAEEEFPLRVAKRILKRFCSKKEAEFYLRKYDTVRGFSFDRFQEDLINCPYFLVPHVFRFNSEIGLGSFLKHPSKSSIYRKYLELLDVYPEGFVMVFRMPVINYVVFGPFNLSHGNRVVVSVGGEQLTLADIDPFIDSFVEFVPPKDE